MTNFSTQQQLYSSSLCYQTLNCWLKPVENLDTLLSFCRYVRDFEKWKMTAIPAEFLSKLLISEYFEVFCDTSRNSPFVKGVILDLIDIRPVCDMTCFHLSFNSGVTGLLGPDPCDPEQLFVVFNLWLCQTLPSKHNLDPETRDNLMTHFNLPPLSKTNMARHKFIMLFRGHWEAFMITNARYNTLPGDINDLRHLLLSCLLGRQDLAEVILTTGLSLDDPIHLTQCLFFLLNRGWKSQLWSLIDQYGVVGVLKCLIAGDNYFLIQELMNHNPAKIQQGLDDLLSEPSQLKRLMDYVDVSTWIRTKLTQPGREWLFEYFTLRDYDLYVGFKDLHHDYLTPEYSQLLHNKLLVSGHPDKIPCLWEQDIFPDWSNFFASLLSDNHSVSLPDFRTLIHAFHQIPPRVAFKTGNEPRRRRKRLISYLMTLAIKQNNNEYFEVLVQHPHDQKTLINKYNKGSFGEKQMLTVCTNFK